MKINSNHAAPHIRKREAFKTHGALSAEWRGRNHIYGTGILPEQYRQQYVNDCQHLAEGDEIYVVLSYATPIAWWTLHSGWVRPETKYSVTTSKHQGKCPRTGD